MNQRLQEANNADMDISRFDQDSVGQIGHCVGCFCPQTINKSKTFVENKIFCKVKPVYTSKDRELEIENT